MTHSIIPASLPDLSELITELEGLMRSGAEGRNQALAQLQDMTEDKRAEVVRATVNEMGGTLLHVAAYENEAVLVRALINWGADIEAQDRDQERPLHWAATGNAQNSLSTLLAADADKEATDRYQETPLMKATIGGCLYTFLGLLEAGADRFRQHAGGVNTMQLAMMHPALADVLSAWEVKAVIRNVIQQRQATP